VFLIVEIKVEQVS